MEKKLNRYLEINETIDHKDGNPLNNKWSNLQILIRRNHCRKHAKRLKEKKFVCPLCSKPFVLSGRKLHDAIQNRLKNRSGPFCNRSCAGRYGTDTQNKKRGTFKVNQITVEYE